ncbi:MAG: hypothetical protein LUH10_15360 [Tannerellaceae bacterium]|nr:hypothetical protein [Tannerellaceae bacterium]
MSLKYHVVSRADIRKEAPKGAKMYYGQIRSAGRVNLPQICVAVSALTSASEGDVEGVLAGLLFQMKQYLVRGDTVCLGDLGNFRVVMGSPGVENEADFSPSMFRKGRIVFSPGRMLRKLCRNAHYEKANLKVIEREADCDRQHIE